LYLNIFRVLKLLKKKGYNGVRVYYMLDGLKYFYYEVHVATFIFISFHVLAERIQHYLALKILKLIVLNV